MQAAMKLPRIHIYFLFVPDGPMDKQTTGKKHLHSAPYQDIDSNNRCALDNHSSFKTQRPGVSIVLTHSYTVYGAVPPLTIEPSIGEPGDDELDVER